MERQSLVKVTKYQGFCLWVVPVFVAHCCPSNNASRIWVHLRSIFLMRLSALWISASVEFTLLEISSKVSSCSYRMANSFFFPVVVHPRTFASSLLLLARLRIWIHARKIFPRWLQAMCFIQKAQVTARLPVEFSDQAAAIVVCEYACCRMETIESAVSGLSVDVPYWASVVGVRWLLVGEHGTLLSIKYLGTELRLGLQVFEVPVS